MVRYCVAKNCNNTSSMTPKRSFFKFPTDIQRAEYWLAVCELEKLPSNLDEIMNNYSEFAICDAHFEECMFSNVMKNRLLKRAIPTIFTETGKENIDDCMTGEAIIIKEEPIEEDTCYSPDSTAIEEWPMEEYPSFHQTNPSPMQITDQEALINFSEDFHQLIHNPVQNNCHTSFVEDPLVETRPKNIKLRSNNKKCRICLVALDRRISARLSEKCHPKKSIKQMIQFCIPRRKLALSDKDYICRNCLKNVRLFVKFIEDFLTVEKQLKGSKKAKEIENVQFPTVDVNVNESSTGARTQPYSTQLRIECHPAIPQVDKGVSRNALSAEMSTVFTDSTITLEKVHGIEGGENHCNVSNSHLKTLEDMVSHGGRFARCQESFIEDEVDEDSGSSYKKYEMGEKSGSPVEGSSRNDLSAQMPTLFTDSTITLEKVHGIEGVENHCDESNLHFTTLEDMESHGGQSARCQKSSIEDKVDKDSGSSYERDEMVEKSGLPVEESSNDLSAEMPTVLTDSTITQVFSSAMNPTAEVDTGNDCFEPYQCQYKIENHEEKVHGIEGVENHCDESNLHFTTLEDMESHGGQNARCQKSFIEDEVDEDSGSSNKRDEMGEKSGSPVEEISEKSTESKSSFSSEQVIEHKIDQKATIHICHTCGCCFEAKSDLRNHLNIHVEHNEYLCDSCSKSFTTLKILNFHKIYSHEKKKSECKYCRKWMRNHSLLEHYKWVHCKDIKHICKICGEDFLNTDVYRNHLRDHISKNYVKVFRKAKAIVVNKRSRPKCET